MSTAGHYQVWLTRDTYERLRAELAALRGERSANVDDRDTAVTADSHPEHDASRRLARIRQIQDVLNRAVVGEAPPDDGIAEPGMVLTVRFDDDDDVETFLLGTRVGENPEGLEVYSPDSPLGTALIGARQGDELTYSVPGGTTVRVTLVRAVPYSQSSESQT